MRGLATGITSTENSDERGRREWRSKKEGTRGKIPIHRRGNKFWRIWSRWSDDQGCWRLGRQLGWREFTLVSSVSSLIFAVWIAKWHKCLPQCLPSWILSYIIWSPICVIVPYILNRHISIISFQKKFDSDVLKYWHSIKVGNLFLKFSRWSKDSSVRSAFGFE